MIEKPLSNYKIIFRELLETNNKIKETLINIDKLMLTNENIKNAINIIFASDIEINNNLNNSLINIDRKYSHLLKM